MAAEIETPTLTISGEKIAWLIDQAHGFDVKVAPFDEGDAETADEAGSGGLENRDDDPLVAELAGFFNGLNEDEEVELVALTWIGRGSYDPDEWPAALATARAEKTVSTGRYLLGIPLLGDYLASGAEAMGIELTADDS